MSPSKTHSQIYPLTDPASLELHSQMAEAAVWQGHPCLRLNGLAVLPGISLRDSRLEVWIGAEGACYPGLVFRQQDTGNYELAYAQPHTSGLWDALQYDPVINGTNTWQLYHGSAYQKSVAVPTGRWFKLQVDFKGRRAAISVDGQPPLVVERLAHPLGAGGVGIWTYLPACFRDMRLSRTPSLPESTGEIPTRAPDVVTDWEADGLGTLKCEPNGALNLNRYFPAYIQEITLRKRFTSRRAGNLALSFGFSDQLELLLDGQAIYSGVNTWKDTPSWADRGYVDLNHAHLDLPLSAGEHLLVARLRKTEYFGWGLIMKLHLQP